MKINVNEPLTPEFTDESKAAFFANLAGGEITGLWAIGYSFRDITKSPILHCAVEGMRGVLAQRESVEEVTATTAYFRQRALELHEQRTFFPAIGMMLEVECAIQFYRAWLESNPPPNRLFPRDTKNN